MPSVPPRPARTVDLDLVDARLERQGPTRVLRATVEVRIDDDPPLIVWARVLRCGRLVDLQTRAEVGTTGDAYLDRAVREFLRREVTHGRSHRAVRALTVRPLPRRWR